MRAGQTIRNGTSFVSAAPNNWRVEVGAGTAGAVGSASLTPLQGRQLAAEVTACADDLDAAAAAPVAAALQALEQLRADPSVRQVSGLVAELQAVTDAASAVVSQSAGGAWLALYPAFAAALQSIAVDTRAGIAARDSVKAAFDGLAKP
jgi:hypothetical protein